jgi:4-alpha-glucanotransferase
MPLPRRASGILLHPTSLPGAFGIGDLGKAAYGFIDFLVASGQQVWQILPIGPTGFGNSPYLSYSALAGNPLLINLEWLESEGLLSAADLATLPEFNGDRIDYDRVITSKLPLLRKASQNFSTLATSEHREAFKTFCQEQAYWLDDYALFMAIKEDHQGQSWYQWDEALAKRNPQALAAYREKLASEIFFHQYLQAEFFRQWLTLKEYANRKGIKIFGDIPIYVAHDSADVWANPEIFRLDEETGEPELMAGVPPDYFSETGQLWGNPVYDWQVLKDTNFKWWVQRIEGVLKTVDLIRIDHFRGFEAYWAVPQGEKVATHGEWLSAPGIEFFTILKEDLGELPIVAEDLGVITLEVEELRDRFEFPGMKLLHFAFDSGTDNGFLPFNYPHNCVVYTGTHDNNTTIGWFAGRSLEEKQRVWDYLGGEPNEGIHWALIRVVLSSVGKLAIVPLQDLLGLGEEGRMNLPGRAEGNWNWRYRSEQLTPEIRDRLAQLTEVYGRAPEKRDEEER